jgi:RNA polymerase sigma-70 factor (ECF subfamily)
LSFDLPESSLPLSFLKSVPGRAPTLSALTAEVVQFFDELRNPLLRYVLSLGLRVDDGEEVVQEVFLALFRHLQQGKPRSNLKGWVFRVGHNLALKQRTRNGRRDRLQCPVDLAGSRLDPQPDPEAEFAAGQRREQLLATVECLTEMDRCCLYLRAEGLRYRQIAEVLGISLGGVSLSLGRSLSRLRKVDEGER